MKSEITPLSHKDREANPNVIFQMGTTLPEDISLCRATFETLKSHGFPIIIDYKSGKRKGPVEITIRTNNPERKEQAFLSTLFEGLQAATHNQLQDDGLLNEPQNEFETIALERTEQIMNGFVVSVGEEGLQVFKEYYSGLRWSTDQERLRRLLFESGTDYDESLLEANMSRSTLITVAHELGFEYDRYGKWYDADPPHILKSNQDIDYRRLRDPEFAETREGQILKRAYAHALGQEFAQQYGRSDRIITPDGNELSRAAIPLSRQPIIEALICDEISIDKPRQKYDFGPSELFDFIAHSDSERAHRSLVTLLTTRLSPQNQQGMFYEGQDEFDHKAQIIWSLLRAYRDYGSDEAKRDILRNDLKHVLEAYTGDGSITITTKAAKNKDSGDREGRIIRKISADMLTMLIVSPDIDLADQAAIIILQATESKKALAVESDPTLLAQSELFLICLDAIDLVSENTNPAILGKTATSVFESDEIGNIIQRFVEMKQRSEVLRNQPNVLKALLNWRKHDFALDEKEKTEKEEARTGFDKEMYPANEILRQLRHEKNQFLLDLVRDAVNGSDLSVPVIAVFDGLIKRVEFSNYDMTTIPEEYYQLMEIARLPNITSGQKNTIVWHIAEQFKYLHDNSEGLLLPVILDIYELILGPLDNVRMPDNNTSIGLAAATSIVRENRSMFKSATPEQLQTLALYSQEIQRLVKMVMGNEFLTAGNHEKSLLEIDINDLKEPSDPRLWNKEMLYQLQYVARELKAVAEYYEGYLHIQAVKVDPSIYYPWILQQLTPFWQGMQLEVGPGNRPSHDISSLFRMMEHYIKNEFILAEEYPKDFDCIGAGHIDGFLLELYSRVVANHDINYNTTVWQKGQTFIHYAVAYMPPKLLDQVISNHRGTSFAKWLKAEHERWNKDQ